jgi:hypothetical protein
MAKEPAPKRRSGDLVAATDVEAKKVQWLWRDRIPQGFITVIAGKPDQGKGLFAAHVAADISKRGGNVLYSAIEDDHGLMTRPRLEASGADLNRILLWRFTLPVQMDELTSLVYEHDIKLVVIDPFSAHLRGVSKFSDNIREVTNALSELAEDTGVAFLIVEHALKKVAKDAHPLAAISGSSSGLPAASRAAYVFGVDPDDSERRLLCCVKMNLRDKPKALSFESDTEEVGLIGEVPMMTCQGETTFDAKRLLSGGGDEPTKVGRKPDKRAAAAEWLTKYLASAGKPVKGGDVKEDAKQFGLTSKTLMRAAEDMGIVKVPPGGGRNCTWDLPADVKQALGVPATPAKGGS